MGRFIRKHPLGFSLVIVYAGLYAVTLAINTATYDFATGSNFSLEMWNTIAYGCGMIGGAFSGVSPETAETVALVLYYACLALFMIGIPYGLAKLVSRYISTEDSSQ